MEHKNFSCDIKGEHTDEEQETCVRKSIPVMFDHDQEDGKSKMMPYFEMLMIDICDRHFEEMTQNRKIIYAYGAMGYNEYSL